MPTNCQSGNPVLNQPCTYNAPICTAFNYSSWSECSPSGNQIRNITQRMPTNCQSGNPLLNQTCTYNYSRCIFNYSSWSECSPSEVKTRILLSSTPNNCEGELILTQRCNYSSLIQTDTISDINSFDGSRFIRPRQNPLLNRTGWNTAKDHIDATFIKKFLCRFRFLFNKEKYSTCLLD